MWNERYSTEEYVYGTEPNQFLKEHADKIPEGKVLCLGAGEGRNAVYLAQQGYEVTAVDQSIVGLEKARKLAAEKGVNIETAEADLAEYRIDTGAWQGIVSVFLHLSADLRERVFSTCVQGLAENGVFILEAFTPSQLKYDTGGPKDPLMLYTLSDLTADLVGLNFEYAEELERELTEGNYHTGKAAVLQLVARKI